MRHPKIFKNLKMKKSRKSKKKLKNRLRWSGEKSAILSGLKCEKKCRKSHSPVENRFCWVTVTFNLQWPSDLTPKYEICVREKKFFDEKGSSKNVEKVFCRLMNFDWLLRFRRQTHPKREKGDLGTYHALREKLWHVSKIRFILRGDRQRTKNLKKLLNHITQLRRSHLTLLEQKRAKKSKNLSFVFKLWR